MIIATTNEYGDPQCAICHEPVEREGQFCTYQDWLHFHEVIYEMGEVIEMNYLDIEDQPWYGVNHG